MLSVSEASRHLPIEAPRSYARLALYHASSRTRRRYVVLIASSARPALRSLFCYAGAISSTMRQPSPPDVVTR